MANQDFNQGTPKKGSKLTRTFTVPEVMVRFKCDVHPWMAAYVGVVAHPYFAVTDAYGAFDIKGLPPGTYTLEAWHETLRHADSDGDDRRRSSAQTASFSFRGRGQEAMARLTRAGDVRDVWLHRYAKLLVGRDAAARRGGRHGDQHQLRPLGA